MRLRFALPALALVFSLLFAGCGGDSKEAPTPAPPATNVDSSSIKDPAAAPSPARPTSTAANGDAANSEPFLFQSTADGMTIKGHLYSTPGPKRKVVILAHGANEDQRSWTAFAQQLAVGGIAAVTFDFRGFGETGGAKDAAKNAADLEVAVRYLKSLDWPLVYVVGSDIGGTAALKVAAGQDLAGVATISSAAAASGLDVTADIPQIVEPKLFLAGAGDTMAATAVITMAGAATDPKTSRIADGTSAHGVALLEDGTSKQALLHFIGSQ